MSNRGGTPCCRQRVFAALCALVLLCGPNAPRVSAFSHGYDDAGNPASRKDFNGRVTTYGYDAMNRLRYRVPDSSPAEPTIEFTYNANGQRETMHDTTGTTVYGYDGRGQLSAKQTPFGTLSYSYYPNGSLARMWSSNVNGVNVSYAYDTLNRLATVTDANLGNTSYTYDEVGNLKSVNYPNAIKHQYTYNALNRLDLLIDRSPTNTIINCWKYHTTGAGQRTWVEQFDHRTAWYTYDNLGRQFAVKLNELRQRVKVYGEVSIGESSEY